MEKRFLIDQVYRFKENYYDFDLSIDNSIINFLNFQNSNQENPHETYPKNENIEDKKINIIIDKTEIKVNKESQNLKESQNIKEIQNDEKLQNIIITKENIHLPLSKGTVAYFKITHYDKINNSNFIITNFYEEEDLNNDNLKIQVERTSKLGSIQYKLYYENEEKYFCFIQSNFSRDSFFSILKINQQFKEISAIKIKTRFQEINKIRQFKSYIPKETIFNKGETSILLKHKEKRHKMIPKPPKMKSGIPTLYFGGRVKMESIKNFILVSPNNFTNKFLVFGKVTHTSYVGEVYHPLSPIQAITLALPHFK